jgi:methyl coenzyme M reductase subunit C-like uncharacterized protein (methanogenesis marker protein 7)
VTVKCCPGGHESGRRVIATADIGRILVGAFADCRVRLKEHLRDDVDEEVVVAYAGSFTVPRERK